VPVIDLYHHHHHHHHHHTHLTAHFPGLPRWAGTRKVKPIWILLKQETVSGSGISWAMCKSAPRSRQITMPAPHRSVFYRPDALPATQPTASKHWRQLSLDVLSANTREQSHFAYSILSFANVNMGNDISVANPAANSNYRQCTKCKEKPHVNVHYTIIKLIYNVCWHCNIAPFPTGSAFDNDERHVTAFRPISEAADSCEFTL